MSVILEFTIEKEEFSLGQVLAGPPPIQIELERIVPTGTSVLPFLWVAGADFETFEQHVLDHEYVDDLSALDRVEDSTLYRITWQGSHNDLIRGITAADGTILEGHADDRWHFRLRFSDHDALSRFHNFCTDHELAIHIVRTHTETDRTESVKQFGLSQEQREALVLPVSRNLRTRVSLTTIRDTTPSGTGAIPWWKSTRRSSPKQASEHDRTGDVPGVRRVRPGATGR